MGRKDFERQVPFSQVRVLNPVVPEPLASLNLKLLEVAAPTYVHHRLSSSNRDAPQVQHLDEMVEKSFREPKKLCVVKLVL